MDHDNAVMPGPEAEAHRNVLDREVRARVPRSRREPLAWVILGVDVVLIAIFGALTRGAFLRPTSLQSLAINSSQIVLLATGAAILLCIGEIDISLGAVLIAASTASATVVGKFPQSTEFGAVVPIGLGVAIFTGMLCTFLTATAVLALKVNSFIASLANLGVFTGVVYVFTNGSNVTGVPLSLQDRFGDALLLGLIPYPAFVAFLGAVIVWFVLRHTRTGVHLIARGSSHDAAERSGVNVRPLIIGAFLAVGALCGLAAFIDISRFGTTDISGHQSDALAAIAGAVIGGTRLSGGRVSILGAVSGALLASIIQTGLIVIGLPPFYQLVAIGIVLLAAVAIGQRRSESGS